MAQRRPAPRLAYPVPVVTRRGVLGGAAATLGALAVDRLVRRDRAVRARAAYERAFSDAVVDTAGMLVVVLDRDDRISRWNPQCEWSTGYGAGQVLGRPLDFLSSAEEAAGARDAIARVRRGEFPLVHEHDWIARDGGARRIAWSFTALTRSDAACDHVIGIGLDVTEQRAVQAAVLHSEARLRAVMAAATEDAIIATDPEGRVRLFNAGAERLLGIAASATMGTPVIGFHDDEELEARAAELEVPVGFDVFAVPAREHGADKREWTYRRADGGRLTVELTVTPMRGDDGAIEGYIGCARDVSERRQLEDALRRSERDMAAVLAMSKEIGEAPDARQAVCDAVARLTEARFVHLLEPAAPGWLARTAGAGSAVGPLRVPLDDEPSGMSTAFNTGRRRFVADTSADPLLASRLTTATGCATVLFEPLLAGGRVLGVLVLGWGDRSEVAFAPSAVRLLAAETAVALDRADRLARLDEQAATDPLTGLLNRRAWDVALAEAIRSSTQARSPLTVAMLDVDHFKAYNDAQGHQAGDRLLKAAAAAWRDALRPGDLLARYGGEEFVALLAGCGAEDAAPVAERLRAATPFGATSSVGLAQWEPGDSAEALLRRADEALYRAKRTGRNRVIAG